MKSSLLSIIYQLFLLHLFSNYWTVLQYFYICYSYFQVNAEFKRITTIPLQSSFLSRLDVLSAKLLKLFKKRGGQIGRQLQTIFAEVSQVRMLSILFFILFF